MNPWEMKLKDNILLVQKILETYIYWVFRKFMEGQEYSLSAFHIGVPGFIQFLAPDLNTSFLLGRPWEAAVRAQVMWALPPGSEDPLEFLAPLGCCLPGTWGVNQQFEIGSLSLPLPLKKNSQEYVPYVKTKHQLQNFGHHKKEILTPLNTLIRIEEACLLVLVEHREKYTLSVSGMTAVGRTC